MKATKIALVSMIAALLPSAANASITIISNAMYAAANDGSGGINYTTFNGMSIPTSTSLNVSDGPNTSSNNINWTTSGNQSIFSFDMSHARNGTYLALAETFESVFKFTSDSNATYDLSGYYHVTDAAAGSSGRVYQSVQFYDSTANINLLYNYQHSESTHNELFTLGGLGGDYDDYLAGSLTGSLLAGHTYGLYFDSHTLAYPNGDAGASATGNLTLKIGEAPAAVPELSSAIVWGCLIAFGAICCQRN